MSEWYKMEVQLGRVREPHKEYTGPQQRTLAAQVNAVVIGALGGAGAPAYHIWAEKKEVPTMQVTYKGLTGKLLKMEFICENYYDITIYEAEKEAKISFSGVKFEDMKFLSGAVSFGG